MGRARRRRLRPARPGARLPRALPRPRRRQPRRPARIRRRGRGTRCCGASRTAARSKEIVEPLGLRDARPVPARSRRLGPAAAHGAARGLHRQRPDAWRTCCSRSSSSGSAGGSRSGSTSARTASGSTCSCRSTRPASRASTAGAGATCGMVTQALADDVRGREGGRHDRPADEALDEALAAEGAGRSDRKKLGGLPSWPPKADADPDEFALWLSAVFYDVSPLLSGGARLATRRQRVSRGRSRVALGRARRPTNDHPSARPVDPRGTRPRNLSPLRSGSLRGRSPDWRSCGLTRRLKDEAISWGASYLRERPPRGVQERGGDMASGARRLAGIDDYDLRAQHAARTSPFVLLDADSGERFVRRGDFGGHARAEAEASSRGARSRLAWPRSAGNKTGSNTRPRRAAPPTCRPASTCYRRAGRRIPMASRIAALSHIHARTHTRACAKVPNYARLCGYGRMPAVWLRGVPSPGPSRRRSVADPSSSTLPRAWRP